MHDYVNEIDILKLAEENGFQHDNLSNTHEEIPQNNDIGLDDGLEL